MEGFLVATVVAVAVSTIATVFLRDLRANAGKNVLVSLDALVIVVLLTATEVSIRQLNEDLAIVITG